MNTELGTSTIIEVGIKGAQTWLEIILLLGAIIFMITITKHFFR